MWACPFQLRNVLLHTRQISVYRCFSLSLHLRAEAGRHFTLNQKIHDTYKADGGTGRITSITMQPEKITEPTCSYAMHATYTMHITYAMHAMYLSATGEQFQNPQVLLAFQLAKLVRLRKPLPEFQGLPMLTHTIKLQKHTRTVNHQEAHTYRQTSKAHSHHAYVHDERTKETAPTT